MLNITSNSNGFTVEAINNIYYPDNGTLTFGPNQVIMILDDVSEMVTFKDNANRRTLFSGILGQISIDGVVVTRDNIIEKFAEVATSQGGGGDMSNYYTKAQSDAKYATKTEVGEYFDNAAYDSQEKKINFYHGDAVVAYVDATDFIKDGMVSNVAISNGNLVITFNVDAGKQDIVIPLSSIFNPANYYTKSEIDGMIPVVPTNVSAFTNDAGYLTQHQSLDDYYTKTEVDADLAAKQDTLTAGANITIENNVISAQGGGAPQVQSDWNQSDSSAVDFIKNKPTIPTVPTDVSAFNNDAGYTTNVGTITGITMNGTSKGTSGVVDLGTVITEHQSLADYYTKTEVDGLIPSVADYFDGAEYDSNSKRINFKHGQTVKAYIDATAFIKDGMVNNVEISGGNLVITFNADAGKETITIPLTDIFNPDNYYDKTETDNKFDDVNMQLEDVNMQLQNVEDDVMQYSSRISELETKTEGLDGKEEVVSRALFELKENKQDTLTAGANITIENNVISATGGGASQVQSDWNQSDSSAVDFIKNKPTIPVVPTNVSDFTNDAGYLTGSDVATVATSGDYDDLTNKPTIPTVPSNVSAFTNDAGYTTNTGTITGITMNGASKGTSGVVDLGTVITEHQSLANYYTKSEVYNKTEIDTMIGNIQTILESI